jgi:hypothetical protein
MSKSQLGVRIPNTLLNKLNSYTQETGTSKTEVVVSAIAEYLGYADSVPLSQRMRELEKRVAALEGKKP